MDVEPPIFYLRPVRCSTREMLLGILMLDVYSGWMDPSLAAGLWTTSPLPQARAGLGRPPGTDVVMSLCPQLPASSFGVYPLHRYIDVALPPLADFRNAGQ